MNYRKYILKPLLILFSLLCVLYLIVFIYVSVNKKSILKQVSQSISEKIKGNVTIGNAELSFFSHFPKVAVELNDMLVKDSLFNDHKHAFFQAKKVFVYLSVSKLVTKKNALKGIRIEDGQLYLFTDTAGYTNRYLLQPKKDSAATTKSSSPSVLKNVTLKNVRFIQDDRRREKLIDVAFESLRADIKTVSPETIIQLKLQSHVHQLGFNLDRGAYLMNKDLDGTFTINYNSAGERLSFKDADVDIDKHAFKIGAEFLFGDQRSFVLDIASKQLTMPFGMSVLTKRLAKNISKFSYDGAMDVTAHIAGPLGGGEPLAHITWKGENINVTTPYAVFTNSTFKGSFDNEVRKDSARNDENSRINIIGFKGNWEGFDIASDNITVDNLTVPLLRCDLRSDFSLSALNNVLQSTAVDLQKGTGSLRVRYNGPLLPTDNRPVNLIGNITIKNGLVAYVPRNVMLKNYSTIIQFTGSDVMVKDMRFNVQDNQFIMNGSAAGLFSLLKSAPDKIVFNWNVFTPSLDLGSFTGLLQPRVRKNITKKANSLQSVSNSLDNMLEKGSVRLTLKANALRYKKFNAANVNGSIMLSEDNWKLNNISLQHGNGNMRLNGTLRAVNNNFQLLDLRSELTNVDVKKVMYAFNNFGQTGIESENISGQLTAVANVSMFLDRKQLQPSEMNGAVDFSLKKGALINYEPMQKLQSFFKHRDMHRVYFAELKDHLQIKNKEITISRMEIQSTAISLFVEGVYSLKGNTDISIQVPLNNMKRRDSSYIPANIGTDAKAGMSLYLRGKPGNDGKIKFTPDILKKLRSK